MTMRRLRTKLLMMVAALAIAPNLVQADNKPTADRAQQLIDKGLEYLKSQQQENGSWQKNEKEPPAFTKIVLYG